MSSIKIVNFYVCLVILTKLYKVAPSPCETENAVHEFINDASAVSK